MTVRDIGRLAAYWKTGSTLNFESAKDIAEKSHKYVEALFFLHLSCEKILKAYYVQQKKEHAPYSHNLLYLAQSAELTLQNNDEKLLSEINEYNLECRYPDDKYMIYKKATEELFETYFKKVEKFRLWILKKLK